MNPRRGVWREDCGLGVVCDWWVFILPGGLGYGEGEGEGEGGDEGLSYEEGEVGRGAWGGGL